MGGWVAHRRFDTAAAAELAVVLPCAGGGNPG